MANREKFQTQKQRVFMEPPAALGVFRMKQTPL